MINKIYLEKPSSKRFVEIELKEYRCITTSGRIGAKTEPKIKEYSDSTKAENSFYTNILSKLKTGYFPPEKNTELHRKSFPLLLKVLFEKCNIVNWLHRIGDIELFCFDWSDSRHIDFPKHKSYVLELDRKRCFWRVWYLPDFDRPMAIESKKESAIIIVDRGLWVARYTINEGIVVEKPMEGDTFRINLEQLKIIGTDLFAISWRRRVYKRIGENQWENIADAIKPSEELTSGEIGFSAISGSSERNFYVGGRRKDLWHYNGTEFQLVSFKGKPPPNQIYCIETDGPKITLGGKNGYIYSYDIDANVAKFDKAIRQPDGLGKSVFGFHTIKGTSVIAYGEEFGSREFLKYSKTLKKFINLNAILDEYLPYEKKWFFTKNIETESKILCCNYGFIGQYESDNGEYEYQLQYFVIDKNTGKREDIVFGKIV